jgi:hypothetical protein
MEYLWIFLIVIAGMVVGFLVIVVVAFLLVKYWLRRVMKQWIDVAEEATKGIVPFMQPLRIKLEAESDPAWNDEASMKRLTKAMKSAGFVDAGIFRIDEVPDICLKALVQPEKSVYAVIYEHPDKGIWFEYFARFEDGTSLTYSTSEATGLDRPPGRGIERFEPDEDASELYQRYLKQLTNKVLLPASIELFVSDFERG